MPSDFGHPFADSTADLIFRSSENVDFYVHKAILGVASSFFREFPYDSPAERHVLTGMSIVPFTEDQRVVEHLLRIVYPVDPPTFDTLDDIRDVLEVGRK